MDFVVYSPQNEGGQGELKVLLWRQSGMTLWADVTEVPRADALAFVFEVASEEAAVETRRRGDGVQVRPAPRLFGEGCPKCGDQSPRPCAECLKTSPDLDDWSHLPGWWERVDLPELRDEVVLARAEGVHQGRAPIVTADMEDTFTFVRRGRGRP